MAEHNQNNTDSDSGNFYNEILSPSELFAARARSHKIPVRGQKEFIPNDSNEQKQRLQQSLDEHWSLISEERVERQGNLVKAKWIPSEHVVELQSPAGKFWQTMGFSAAGKQCLLPEEALYLMECGSVQVFHQDLPLSIQDGYERFLSSSTVSLQQYQVFGHLKRLGYVVHRFDASSEPSSYARQLNLPCDRSTRQAKRKRSPSPTPANSRMDTQDASTTESKKGPSKEESEADTKVPDSQMSVTLGSSAAQDSMETSPEECGGRKWWLTDAGGQHQSHPRESSGSHRWDRSVPFPDLGSWRKASSCLPSPDPALLPGGLSVGKCDVSRWEHRINLRKVKMSAREEERERDMRRRRSDINRDKEVQRCRNWAEYQQLLARRQGTHSGRPAHLWHSEVTPLHDPTQPIPTGELLDKISVIKSTHLHEDASRLEASEEWRICFNVYQPDSVADFKKSNPGKPYARMCVCSFDGPVPDLRAMKLLAFQSGDIPVVYAVVDYGDISFYTFKTFQLPKDVFP